MSTWKIVNESKLPKLKNPILIEGLPGIGNVGKVAVDFLVDELEAKKIMTMKSKTFPHSVFINEKNLIEMPSIEVYHKKCKKNDVLLLVGDVQPTDEISCYEFCEEIIKFFKSHKGDEIITLGGIGLQDIPKSPKIYLTGNSKKIIQKYKKDTKLNEKLYGVVGPIVGVSGLLIGMAKNANMDAVCLLAETYGHPMYLGIKGAREVLKVLSKKLYFNIKFGELDKEIEEIEKGFIKPSDLQTLPGTDPLKKLKQNMGEDVNYIG
tara:strand:+ start:1633 stop:2424 length:792 start_codon:yes stop_codon:yes gene_type:complete